MSLAIVGGTVVDVIFSGVKQLPAWPDHTEFTPSNLELLTRPPLITLGGNGANAAFVAARRGARVTLYSAIGNDAMGKLARGWMREAGCRVIATGAGKATAINVTAVNKRYERATLFYPGEPTIMPDFSTIFPRNVKPAAVLVCGWPHPSLAQVARGFKALRRRHVLTALDPGPILGRPWTLRTLQPVFKELGLLLANEFELCAITKTRGISGAVRRLRHVYSGDVVIKCGERGVVWLPADTTEEIAVPAPRVTVFNTVGAGDAFNGALLAALLRGTLFPQALKEANTVAARLVASSRGVLGVPSFHPRPTTRVKTAQVPNR